MFGPAQAGDTFSMAILLDNITQLIFTVTTALMVITKYKDKESRGAK